MSYRLIMNLAAASLALVLVACGGASTSDTASPPMPSTDPPIALVAADASAPDALPDAPAPPCTLTVESLEAVTVLAGQAHNTLITARGSCFVGVRDVEVNVQSVPFAVIDDHTIVFLAAQEPIDLALYELPYRVEIDIIKVQPDQVQTFLSYVAR